MAALGGYQTAGEISRGALSEVWSARPVGSDQPPRHAIKLLQPALLEDPRRAQALVDDFLQAAEVQRRAASASERHWAPILEAGKTDGGAFYVTHLYSRSLEQLVLGKIRLTALAMRAVAGSILRGLRELRDACGRAHGNLKLTNVLIEGEGNLAAARFVLTDPAPAARLGPTAARDDLRALGEILYSLVLHRSAVPGPVASSAEWSRLGPGGEAWRRLCERLLDPSVGLDELDLDELAAQVSRIRVSRTTRNIVLAVLALLLAGAGGGTYWYFTYGPSAPVPDPPPDWVPLCQSYSRWFLAFYRGLEEPDRRTQWTGEPGLARILALLDKARSDRVELDPRKIVGTKLLPKDLAGTLPRELPPECQAILFTRRGHDRSRAAWAVVSAVERELADWPLRRQVEDLGAEYRRRGWAGHADYLQSLSDSLRPPTARVVEAGDAILKMLPTSLAGIENRWRKIQAGQDAFQKVTPPEAILGRFGDFVNTNLRNGGPVGRPEDLDDLLRKVDDLAGLTGEIQKALQAAWETLDKDWFLSHSDVHAAFARTAGVSRETYLNWLVEVQSPKFRLAADRSPFADSALAGELAKADSDLRELAPLERLYPQPRAADLGRRLKAIQEEVAAGRREPFCLARMEEVAPRAQAVRGRLATLHGEARDQTAALRKVPAGADPRLAVQAAIADTEKAIRLRESRRDQFQARYDGAWKAIKDPLALEWIVAHEAPIQDRQAGYAQSVTALKALKLEIDKLPIDEDPRPALRIAMDKAQADIRQLAEGLKDPLGPSAYGKRLADLDSRGFWKVAWSRIDQRLAVVDDAEACKKDLAAIQGELDARRQAVQQVQAMPMTATGSPVLEAEWAKRRDGLIAATLDPQALISQASAQASLLQKIAAQFVLAQVSAFGNDPLPREIVAAKREDSIRSLLAAGELAIREAADGKGTLLDAYKGWGRQVPELAADFREIESALDEGFGLTEARPPGKTVEEVAGKWSQAAVAADFARVLDKSLARLKGLRGLGQLDRKALLEQAGRTDDFAAALNSWRMLGDKRFTPPWPDGRDGLTQETRIRERLAAHLAHLADGPRKQALRKELADQGPPRWMTAFASVSSAADVEWAADQAETYGFQPAMLTSLPPQGQFNYRLRAFAREQKAFQDKLVKRPPEEQQTLLQSARREIEAFKAATQALGPAGEDAAVKEYLERVDKVLAWTPKKEDISKAGPSLVGWAAQKVDDRQLQFTWKVRERTHELTFLLVEPSAAGANAAYLCTTEVSVALFRDVMAELGKSLKLEDLLSGGEAWAGPRAWKLESGALDVNGTWQTQDPLLSDPVDPQKPPKPPVPEETSPMQALSPLAALCMARLLACRLPTSAEWTTAYESVRKDSPTGLVFNLRDAAFARQRDALQKYYADNADAPRAWPDTGIFWPDSIPAAQRATGEKAAARSDAQDDGLLWFTGVDHDVKKECAFHHLVGNVAEMVCEETQPWNKPTEGDVLEKVKAALTGLARKQAIAVIGGSALSPPGLKDATPYPLNDPPADKETRYTDVGFRLAFTAPTQPLDELVRRLVENPPYLLRKPTP